MIIVIDIDKKSFNDEGKMLMYVGTSRAKFKLSCIINMSEDECLEIMRERNVKSNRNIRKSFATFFNSKIIQ